MISLDYNYQLSQDLKLLTSLYNVKFTTSLTYIIMYILYMNNPGMTPNGVLCGSVSIASVFFALFHIKADLIKTAVFVKLDYTYVEKKYMYCFIFDCILMFSEIILFMISEVQSLIGFTGIFIGLLNALSYTMLDDTRNKISNSIYNIREKDDLDNLESFMSVKKEKEIKLKPDQKVLVCGHLHLISAYIYDNAGSGGWYARSQVTGSVTDIVEEMRPCQIKVLKTESEYEEDNKVLFVLNKDDIISEDNDMYVLDKLHLTSIPIFPKSEINSKLYCCLLFAVDKEACTILSDVNKIENSKINNLDINLF